MVRRGLVLASLIFIVFVSDGQVTKCFEGSVTYRYEVILKSGKLDASKLEDLFGYETHKESVSYFGSKENYFRSLEGFFYFCTP